MQSLQVYLTCFKEKLCSDSILLENGIDIISAEFESIIASFTNISWAGNHKLLKPQQGLDTHLVMIFCLG